MILSARRKLCVISYHFLEESKIMVTVTSGSYIEMPNTFYSWVTKKNYCSSPIVVSGRWIHVRPCQWPFFTPNVITILYWDLVALPSSSFHRFVYLWLLPLGISEVTCVLRQPLRIKWIDITFTYYLHYLIVRVEVTFCQHSKQCILFFFLYDMSVDTHARMVQIAFVFLIFPLFIIIFCFSGGHE